MPRTCMRMYVLLVFVLALSLKCLDVFNEYKVALLTVNQSGPSIFIILLMTSALL